MLPSQYILFEEVNAFMDNDDSDIHLHKGKSVVKNNKIKTKNSKNNKNHRDRWPLVVTGIAFLISSIMSLISETTIQSADLFMAWIILIIIIAIGVIFDIIGVAVTASKEAPFHARSARKMPGAALAVQFVRNADKMSSFCNDVIGDIAGVISGAAGAVIAGKLIVLADNSYDMVISIMLSAGIASLTIGGKALGKNYAINNSEEIVYRAAYILDIIMKSPKYLISLMRRERKDL